MVNMISGFQRQLCDIQGRLFERSQKQGLNSLQFIEKFMNSQTCEFFDMPYDRLQWAGEEYILENLLDETDVEKDFSDRFGLEELFWTGYVYRYWHFLKNENSREIYKQADACRMKDCYAGFHTLDIALAIDNLKEIYNQALAKP